MTFAAHPTRLAGFWIRTLAYLLDALLLSLVGGAFQYLVVANTQGGQPSSGAAGGSVLVPLIYFMIFWSRVGGGRTLGMRLVGLRVIHGDGSLIGLVGALVRWFGLWLSFVICFLGVIWVAFDGRKQGWHDKLAKTFVVHL